MADLVSIDNLIASLANRSQIFSIDKTQAGTTAASHIWSWWTSTGIPGPGVAPTAAAIPTSATAGSLASFVASGNANRIASIDAYLVNPAPSLYLFDRLAHSGGLVANITTLQTTNLPTPALTRATNGVGVVGFLEVYTTLGATPSTATVIYTNQDGTGSRTGTAAITASAAAGRLLPIVLQTGDRGIKSIESVQITPSTGTAGNFGVTLGRRIHVVGITDSTPVMTLRASLEQGYPLVEDNACLWFVAHRISSTTFGAVRGGFTIFSAG